MHRENEAEARLFAKRPRLHRIAVSGQGNERNEDNQEIYTQTEPPETGRQPGLQLEPADHD